MATANAADLHTLLARAQVSGPYVLVGHSCFQAFPASIPGCKRARDCCRQWRAWAGCASLFYTTALAGLPPQARSEERADWSRPSHYRSLRDEVLELQSALTQSQALTSLGNKPLIVVTAVKDAEEGWMPLQDEMLTLSTNSVQRVMQNATHTSLTEDKAEAGISSQAILDVVGAVRSSTPLAK